VWSIFTENLMNLSEIEYFLKEYYNKKNFNIRNSKFLKIKEFISENIEF
jgi:hypothetical protein